MDARQCGSANAAATSVMAGRVCRLSAQYGCNPSDAMVRRIAEQVLARQ